MRTSAQGYNVPDSNRQKYAMLERDSTGLDHTWWRKYESTAGRWTSPDPMPGNIGDPQSFNRYTYTQNDPVNFVDPTGLLESAGGTCYVDGIPVNCGMAFSLINMGFATVIGGTGFYLNGSVLIVNHWFTSDRGNWLSQSAFFMDPQQPLPPPIPQPHPTPLPQPKKQGFIRCFESNRFSALARKGTKLNTVLRFTEIVPQLSLGGDLSATLVKGASAGVGGPKQPYASGLNFVFRRLATGAASGALTAVGDTLTPVLSSVGAFTTGYNLSAAFL